MNYIVCLYRYAQVTAPRAGKWTCVSMWKTIWRSKLVRERVSSRTQIFHSYINTLFCLWLKLQTGMGRKAHLWNLEPQFFCFPALEDFPQRPGAPLSFSPHLGRSFPGVLLLPLLSSLFLRALWHDDCPSPFMKPHKDITSEWKYTGGDIRVILSLCVGRGCGELRLKLTAFLVGAMESLVIFSFSFRSWYFKCNLNLNKRFDGYGWSEMRVFKGGISLLNKNTMSSERKTPLFSWLWNRMCFLFKNILRHWN